MTNHAIEQEIINLANQWIVAVGQRDRATLERIIADDFLIAGWLPHGQLGDRQTYIEDCMRPITVENSSYNYDKWKFRIYGNIAVVNCILKIHALVGGSDWGGVFVQTQVWVKREGLWRVGTCHSSSVLETEGKAAE